MIRTGAWTVRATTDDDGHLTVYIDHDDRSQLHEIEEDFGDPDGKMTLRFTTTSIEKAYDERAR